MKYDIEEVKNNIAMAVGFVFIVLIGWVGGCLLEQLLLTMGWVE